MGYHRKLKLAAKKGVWRTVNKKHATTLNFIVRQVLSQDVQLSSLMLDGFVVFLRIWSLENRRSYGARKKHKRLPRLAMKCFRPCFFYISQSLSGNAMTGLRSCQIFFCPTVRKFFMSLFQCQSPGKPQMAHTKIAFQQTQGFILNERSW